MSKGGMALIEEAFAAWGDGLYRFALRLTCNREDAEDIVVETFVEAIRNWDRFDKDKSLKNWLYGIAVNRIRMTRRRRKPDFEAMTSEIVAHLPNVDDAIVLEQALTRLASTQRESFLLMKGEGFSAKEASEILRRPVGTVLYEVHMAAKALFRSMNEEEK